MIVTMLPLSAPDVPVALVERKRQGQPPLRVLVLREGLVPRPVVNLLSRLLAEV